MRYRAIQESDRRYLIHLVCRALVVSPAGYYAWRHRPEGRRGKQNRTRLATIRVLHRESREAYGSPRIGDSMSKQGHDVKKHRVAGLMCQAGLRAKTVKTWRDPTQSHRRFPVAENTLNRQFNVRQPNRVWTTKAWLYLAVRLDLYSRFVIGWAMGERLTGALVEHVLTMALAKRPPTAGLLHHSDRGSQYAARNYQPLLTKHGLTPSMSRKGNCWDKACVESFFGTLKRELAYPRHYVMRDEAKRDMFE